MSGDKNNWSVNKYLPSGNDEPTKFLGINSIGLNFVEMCSWSHTRPKSFTTTILASTCFKPKSFEDAMQIGSQGRLTLQELARASGTVIEKVFFHIVAKKVVDVMVNNNKIILIPTLIVADDTGYATLVSMNEGFQCFYNGVDIGDCVLLNECFPQHLSSKNSKYHENLFAKELCINLELKYKFYHVRLQNKIQYSFQQLQHFIFPKNIIDTIKVVLPYELKNIEQDKKASEIDSSTTSPYFDVVGVISWIGRVERSRLNEEYSARCRIEEDEKIVQEKIRTHTYVPRWEIKNVQRYNLYRWIFLVDKEATEPIAYKLYITNTNFHNQPDLIPGAIVVFTHSLIEKRYTFPGPFICSSQFSQTVLGSEIFKYMSLRKSDRIVSKMTQIISHSNYKETITRNNISWGCGGTLLFELPKPRSVKYFSGNLERREAVTQIIRAKLVHAVVILSNNTFRNVFTNGDEGDNGNDDLYGQGGGGDYYAHFFPKYIPYCFRYKLSMEWKDKYDSQRTREVASSIVNNFSLYCNSLLLPPKYTEKEMKDKHANILGKHLEPLDGPPYIVVQIRDVDSNSLHNCIWKRRKQNTDIQQDMITRLVAAKTSQSILLCAVEFFKVEENVSIEKSIHDFVVLK